MSYQPQNGRIADEPLKDHPEYRWRRKLGTPLPLLRAACGGALACACVLPDGNLRALTSPHCGVAVPQARRPMAVW